MDSPHKMNLYVELSRLCLCVLVELFVLKNPVFQISDEKHDSEEAGSDDELLDHKLPLKEKIVHDAHLVQHKVEDLAHKVKEEVEEVAHKVSKQSV